MKEVNIIWTAHRDNTESGYNYIGVEYNNSGFACKATVKVIDNDFTNILNISNRLSKYLPDILEKIQELYEDCAENSNYDSNKAQITNRIYNKLFKNNQTIINFKGFKDLVNSFVNAEPYIKVILMMCITYIIVKFMGMFNMKIDV